MKEDETKVFEPEPKPEPDSINNSASPPQPVDPIRLQEVINNLNARIIHLEFLVSASVTYADNMTMGGLSKFISTSKQ